MHRCKVTTSYIPTLVYTAFDEIHTNKVVPNLVDPLCVEFKTDSDGKVVEAAFCSDISLLFNQTRLENALGKDGLKKFFDSFSQRSSSLSRLRSKISDADLARVCKSRYLQAPSEILAWSNYLEANYQSLVSELDKSDSSDSAPTDSAPTDLAPTASV